MSSWDDFDGNWDLLLQDLSIGELLYIIVHGENGEGKNKSWEQFLKREFTNNDLNHVAMFGTNPYKNAAEVLLSKQKFDKNESECVGDNMNYEKFKSEFWKWKVENRRVCLNAETLDLYSEWEDEEDEFYKEKNKKYDLSWEELGDEMEEDYPLYMSTRKKEEVKSQKPKTKEVKTKEAKVEKSQTKKSKTHKIHIIEDEE